MMKKNKQTKCALKFFQIQQQRPGPNLEEPDGMELKSSKLQIFGFQCQNEEEVDIETIYEYSQRNARMAQELVVQQNYLPQTCQYNNLKQSRQLEAQSPKVSRPFFINPSFLELQKQNNNILQENCLTLPYQQNDNSSISQKENHIKKQPQQKQSPARRVQNRVSIVVNTINQTQDDFQNSKRGLIPLRSANKKESLAIHTYRLLKSRYQNLQNQRQNQELKKKKHNIKKQESRFKGTTITYDYDGQPIPLRNFKKHQTNNFMPKPCNQVSIVPLPQNIVLPSTMNKKRLQKRKAKYLNEQKQKQNLRKSQQEQHYSFYEGSDFIRKTPSDIKKNKLFHKQKDEENQKKKPGQVTFSEYKKNAGKIRNTQNCHIDFKEHKYNMSNLSDVHSEVKSKVVVKKPNPSQGKVIVNEKVFQSIFKLKASNTVHEIYEENQERKVVLRSNKKIRNQTFHNSFVSPKLNQTKLAFNVLSIKNPAYPNLTKRASFNYKDFEKTSILRHSMQNSPDRLHLKQYSSMHTQPKKPLQTFSQSIKKLDLEQKAGYHVKDHKQTNKIIGSKLNRDGRQEKKKLKTRASYRNLIVA